MEFKRDFAVRYQARNYCSLRLKPQFPNFKSYSCNTLSKHPKLQGSFHTTLVAHKDNAHQYSQSHPLQASMECQLAGKSTTSVQSSRTPVHHSHFNTASSIIPFPSTISFPLLCCCSCSHSLLAHSSGNTNILLPLSLTLISSFHSQNHSQLGTSMCYPFANFLM